MSSLAFVESNTTGTGMLALHKARQLGMKPLFLTAEPRRYRGLGEAHSEILVCDTNRLDALADQLRGREIAGVTTTSEYFLPIVAELAAGLGLPGNPPSVAHRCRDKSSVRSALSGSGVRQPRFAVVDSPQAVAEAVAVTGMPCVVKPVDESGSAGVRLCRNQREAQDQVSLLLSRTVNGRKQPAATRVLVEEYARGPEYSVETFSVDGEVRWSGVTEKCVRGKPWFVETGHVFPAPVPVDQARALVRTAQEAVASLGIRLGAAHSEIRLTPEGPVLIEMNARLAGGMIPELIRLATGLDLLDLQLRAAAGLPVLIEPTLAGYAGIEFLTSERPGTFLGVAGTAEARRVSGVEGVVTTMAPGSRVIPAQDAYQRLGHVIAAAASVTAVRGALTGARQQLTVLVEEDSHDRTS